MLSVKTPDTVNQPVDVTMESIGKIREQLEQEKRRVCAEIDDYPHPIPACDAQFNYLLEERARIFQELSRLDAMLQKNRG